MASGPITSWQIDGETAGTVTDSSTLAWKIPWMEEPGRLQASTDLELEKFLSYLAREGGLHG